MVAYQQPVTRGDVERVRGVDSDSVMRSLLHRRLITEAGRRDSPGRPILFRTTFTFLERFGLESLDELPPLILERADWTDPRSSTEAASACRVSGCRRCSPEPASPRGGRRTDGSPTGRVSVNGVPPCPEPASTPRSTR